jgi:hypothetical protein
VIRNKSHLLHLSRRNLIRPIRTSSEMHKARVLNWFQHLVLLEEGANGLRRVPITANWWSDFYSHKNLCQWSVLSIGLYWRTFSLLSSAAQRSEDSKSMVTVKGVWWIYLILRRENLILIEIFLRHSMKSILGYSYPSKLIWLTSGLYHVLLSAGIEAFPFEGP